MTLMPQTIAPQQLRVCTFFIDETHDKLANSRTKMWKIQEFANFFNLLA